MRWKSIVAALTLCVITVLALTLFVGQVRAQDDTASLDQELGQRRGISGSLAPVKKGEGGGPTTLQMAVGVGSIFVMIAVVKWL
jgi:hypothetical protein